MRRSAFLRAASTRSGYRCAYASEYQKSIGIGNQPPPLVIGDIVFATGGDAGGYFALAARTGRILWHFPTAGATYSPPIAAGGRIFGAELDGTMHAFVRG